MLAAIIGSSIKFGSVESDMPLVRFCTVALVIGTWLLPAFSCPGQLADSFQDHARDAAADYEIHTSLAPPRKLDLRPEPILGWTNPVPEKQMRGEVFLW